MLILMMSFHHTPDESFVPVVKKRFGFSALSNVTILLTISAIRLVFSIREA
jgi:hypothetical protein